MVFYKSQRRSRRLGERGFTLVEAVVATTLIGVGVAATLGALTKFNSVAAMSRNATGATALLMNQVDLFQAMSPFNPQRTPAEIPKDAANNPPMYDMTAGALGVPVMHVIGYQDPTTGSILDPCKQPANDRDTWPVYREPARWNYANAAERAAASGFTVADIGSLAYEVNTQTFWKLQTAAPTWVADTTGGYIVKGTMTCTVTDISPVANTPPYIYKAVFTIGYQYGSRDGGKGGPIWNAAYKPCGSAAAVGRWEYQVSMSALRTSDI